MVHQNTRIFRPIHRQLLTSKQTTLKIRGKSILMNCLNQLANQCREIVCLNSNQTLHLTMRKERTLFLKLLREFEMNLQKTTDTNGRPFKQQPTHKINSGHPLNNLPPRLLTITWGDSISEPELRSFTPACSLFLKSTHFYLFLTMYKMGQTATKPGKAYI